jgi:hypothetical protein
MHTVREPAFGNWRVLGVESSKPGAEDAWPAVART